jgi:hypothetical protein
MKKAKAKAKAKVEEVIRWSLKKSLVGVIKWSLKKSYNGLPREMRRRSIFHWGHTMVYTVKYDRGVYFTGVIQLLRKIHNDATEGSI